MNLESVRDHITYRSTTPSSFFGQKWAAGHCSRVLPRTAGCSSPHFGGSQCGREGGRWSSGTELGSIQSVSLLPSPRSGASAASHRQRLDGRASSQPRPRPEKGAGAARRLNGPQSHLAVGCCEAGLRDDRVPTSSGAGGCADAPVTNTTCSPNHAHCSTSSSRTLRPPPRRRSSGLGSKGHADSRSRGCPRSRGCARSSGTC